MGLGHCKAPEVSLVGAQTLVGTAELTSGHSLCFRGAVVVFWKHCCEISLVQLFKQKEQSCHARTPCWEATGQFTALTNTSHLAKSTGSAAELPWLAQASLWVLPPINHPDLGRRINPPDFKVDEGGGISPGTGEATLESWHLCEVEPALHGWCVHSSGHSHGHLLWGIPWESRLLLQDVDVQGAAEPLGSLLSVRGAGDVTKSLLSCKS